MSLKTLFLTACVVLCASTVHAQRQTCGTETLGLGAPCPTNTFGFSEIPYVVGQPFAAGGFNYRDQGDINPTFKGKPYTHLVMANQCTDSNNPFGTPAQPRCTFPSSPPAGSVVLIHRDLQVADNFTWNVNATASLPVFVTAFDDGSWPIIDSGAAGYDQGSNHNLSGSFVAYEYLHFRGTVQVGTAAANEGIWLRHCEVDQGSAGANVYFTAGHDNGMWDCQPHDGHRSPGEVHNVQVADGVGNIWLHRNDMHHPSGDNVQFCHGCRNTSGSGPDAVYVSRNRMRGGVLPNQGVCAGRASDCPSENGVDLKGYIGPVVITENDIDGESLAYEGANAQCIRINDEGVTQGYVPIIGNRCHGMRNGVDPTGSTAGEDPNGGGGAGLGGVYVVGNMFYNIPGTCVSGGGTKIVNNSFFNCGTAINGTYQGATRYSDVSNNIIVNSSASIVAMGSDDGCTRNTVFNSGPVSPSCSLTQTANPQLMNPLIGDFSIPVNSPSKDVGTVSSYYATFASLFKLSIQYDYTGTARPQDVMDHGAYEFVTGGGGEGVPAAPTGVRIIK